MEPFKYNGGLQINPSLLSPARVTTNFQVMQDRGVAPRHLQGCESILEIKETMRLLCDLDREKVLSECGPSYWRSKSHIPISGLHRTWVSALRENGIYE